LKGYNGTILVYGQTGTGKTHTMGTLSTLGISSSGIVPLAMGYIYDHFQDAHDGEIAVSFMQIYRGDIIDLLDPNGKALSVREDPQSHEVYVEDLVIVPVHSLEQVMNLINAGMESRAIGR